MNKRISLKWKLISIVAVCVVGFIIFGLVAKTTVDTVKVRGPYYNKITTDKDLVADILPPPHYIIESYFTLLLMLQTQDKSELDQLALKMKALRKDYNTRHEFWVKDLPNGRMHDLIAQDAHVPATEFYDLCDKEVIPLILAGKKAEAAGVIEAKLHPLYQKHRKAIDELVDLATKDSEKVEAETSDALQKYMLSMYATAGIALLLMVTVGILLSRSITKPVEGVVRGLGDGADQVAAASSEIAAASQRLAEGASQQAAAIEETSSSLEEMASMTRQNADSASQAKELMRNASGVVNAANESMGHLAGSMQRISKASEETQKIIKTIDEIAFQTNLLALNAAVEAARAGEAGAGFAVVADEVRNLAMRAAEAAKNTAALIEDTVKSVAEGSGVAEKTAGEFAQVATSVSRLGELVGEIAEASQEQAQGIDQINKAVSEMDKVVQQNAANAEESASASEEMNAQAEQMRSFIRDLETLVRGGETGGDAADWLAEERSGSIRTNEPVHGVTLKRPEIARRALPTRAPRSTGSVAKGKSASRGNHETNGKAYGPERLPAPEHAEFDDF